MNKFDIALFDLDGTISSSADGIKLCIQKTLDKMGKEHPDLSDYSKYIGPPLVHTFKNLCGLSETEAQTAVEIYVKFYDEFGIDANKLYDNMEKVLGTLRNNGVKLAVCSSKHEDIATLVVKKLGVYDYFLSICGSAVDSSRKEKHELIPYALSKIGGKDTDRVVMIGDTKFDALGAKQCSVDFIGVTYGYGDKKDMVDAGAEVFADTPEDLLKFML